jgi:phosphatidylethanolamine/phosphatidyl-N-methylethanolamine N-methyltransferase
MTSSPNRGIRDDDLWLRWQTHLVEHYDQVFYEGNPLVRHVTNAGHRLLEEPFGRTDMFDRVLEVGAGAGEHLPFVRHRFDQYVLGDSNLSMLHKVRRVRQSRAGVTATALDAAALPHADSTFDRLVSVYNLEHVPHPHVVLKEWARVVRPGGILSIAIPTEGGLAWSLGRHISTRRTFRNMGFDYDYIVAREHVNTCARLCAFIRYYFDDRVERWYPTGIPSPHLNLVFTATIRVHKSGGERERP